ncbi:hypothetical protein [Paractinoplanes maris]|uniref:hypothetical protein n=1 Tax=Paractinoplanes maris TaxID=1734446 RepID=UPI00201FE1CD|nr:hypothetical protein [Actinoplanes maris]
MRNADFYITTAQVLPALLIAFAIEANVFFRQRFRAQQLGMLPIGWFGDRFHDPDERARAIEARRWPNYRTEPQRYRTVMTRRLVRTVPVAIIVFLGEVAALTVLWTGTDGWFPLLAAPICAIAMVIMTGVVVLFLMLRFVLPDTEQYEPPQPTDTTTPS